MADPFALPQAGSGRACDTAWEGSGRGVGGCQPGRAGHAAHIQPQPQAVAEVDRPQILLPVQAPVDSRSPSRPSLPTRPAGSYWAIRSTEVSGPNSPATNRSTASVSANIPGITRCRSNSPRRASPSASTTSGPTWRAISLTAALATAPSSGRRR